MIGELVCPDCGGVVGATKRTEAGDPCRCFADSSSSAGTLLGTVVSRLDPDEPPPPPVAKVCKACGKDLNGHRRVKDGGAYLCVPCAKEDEKRENYGRVRCRVCGHLVKEEKLTDYEGTKMCPACHEQRTTVRRQQIKRLGFRGARTREELRQIYILVAIGAALAVIAIVGLLIHHFR